MAEMKLGRLVVGNIYTNAYLVMNSETSEMIIIDPGDEAGRIIKTIDGVQGKPVAILLTHGHFDHILAVEEIKKTYNIPVIAYETEKELLADARVNMSAAYGLDTVIEPDRTVTDNEEIEIAGFGIKVLHTPGHTAGSCCYYFPEAGVVFSGDTMFKYSYGRTDFVTSNALDMEKSIKRMLDELPDETVVYPGHDADTIIKMEKRYNPLA